MKGSQIMKVIKIINIITALLLIGLSGLSLAFIVINSLTSFKPFLLFSPVFMIGFGICMLAAEFKVKWLLKRLPFLKQLLGRGLFNIYISSVLYYYFSAAGSQLVAWIGAMSFFVSGLIYVGIHFGCGAKVQKERQKKSGRQDDNQNQNFRQPLM